MALTEETKIDRMEILEDGQIQIRRARIIYDNGNEIYRTFHREVLDPGKPQWNIVASDARVQAVANAVWTEAAIAKRVAALDKLPGRKKA